MKRVKDGLYGDSVMVFDGCADAIGSGVLLGLYGASVVIGFLGPVVVFVALSVWAGRVGLLW